MEFKYDEAGNHKNSVPVNTTDNNNNYCKIIDEGNWLFKFDDKKKADLVPGWFRKWDDYVKSFPIGKIDLATRKVTILNNNDLVEVNEDTFYFRYLQNANIATSRRLKNYTQHWRLDVTSSLFKRMPRYEATFQRGYLAESWHDGLRQRFVDQSNWYKLIESGVKEGDFIEKGIEKKLTRQWKNLIEITSSPNYHAQLEQELSASSFDYPMPFARSIRPLKKFLEKYQQHFIHDKRVLVIGSTYPWLEIEVFLKSPYHVTSVTEFDLKSLMPYNHPHLSYIHPRKLSPLQDDEKLFDFVVSFSSLEHLGLGRYGDPLNPDGDLMEMAKLSCLVKPGGLMLLGVPVDGDCLEYSYRRFYGPVRYSLLAECWRVVEFESFDLDECKTRDWTYQPWFVLQNLRGCSIIT